MTGLPQEHRVLYVSSRTPDKSDTNFELSELAVDLWRSRTYIGIIVFACTLSAYIFTTFIFKPIYRAQATIQPTKESTQIIGSLLDSTLLKKNLIENYNLLPILYSEKWDNNTNQWKVDIDKQPVVQTVFSDNKFPMRHENTYTIIWEGKDSNFCLLMVERVILELQKILETTYISNAELQINILESELLPTIESYHLILNKIWDIEKISIAQLEILTNYTRLKAKITELQIEDQLTKRFDIISEPLVYSQPFWPNRERIIMSTAFGSLIFSVLTTLLYNTLSSKK
jgi:hypothetical protein